MLKDHRKLLLFGAAALLGSATMFAGNDIDLMVNGDFRGASIGAESAPGWYAEAGSTRIVNGQDWDEFAVEVTAPADKAQSVWSEFFPVSGKVLKLETVINGSGAAKIGFLAFDADKKPIVSGNMFQAYEATAIGGKTKNYFTITDPQIKFVRICLTSEPGSKVTFGDVEAEFKLNAAAAAPAAMAGTTATAPLPAAVPVKCSTGEKAVTSCAKATETALMPLVNKRLYLLKDIGNSVYNVTLPVGSEIEFKLEEDVDKGIYWSIESYNAAVCRVKIEHDRDGIWPFRYDNAEIELKATAPGSSPVVFSCAGKTFTVMLTVK